MEGKGQGNFVLKSSVVQYIPLGPAVEIKGPGLNSIKGSTVQSGNHDSAEAEPGGRAGREQTAP